MGKQECAKQKKQLRRHASLFEVTGLAQTNKQVKGKMKNENGAIVWLKDEA
jgi:hypothetical protein